MLFVKVYPTQMAKSELKGRMCQYVSSVAVTEYKDEMFCLHQQKFKMLWMTHRTRQMKQLKSKIMQQVHIKHLMARLNAFIFFL
jgi:hypothetical protein